jgi:hypothetical protein
VNSSSAASTGRLMDTLAHVPAVAILRASHARHLVAAAEVIADAGIRGVESPLTTPGGYRGSAGRCNPARPGSTTDNCG